MAGQVLHQVAGAAEYEIILTRAHQTVAGFPPLLRGLAEPLLSELSEGSFSQIVALLPYWVIDLLDRHESPATGRRPERPGEAETLGLANLFGWWSYLIQDQLLDQPEAHLELQPLALALYAIAVRLLAQVVPCDEAFWDAFQALSLQSAEAQVCEQRCHVQSLAHSKVLDLHRDFFTLDNLERLANRSALLRLAALAPLAMRGYGPEDRLSVALSEALRHYAMARQVADDRTDWVEDLRCGRLNYVSACIVRRLLENGSMCSHAELDAERMAGHFLYDNELFAEIQNVIQAACQRAAQLLAPFGPSCLGTLVDELALQAERSYQAALATRHELQGLFSALHRLPARGQSA